MAELSQNTTPIVGLITLQEDQQLIDALLPCGIDILTLPAITGNIEDWDASPDIVLFDTRNLLNWQQDWQQFNTIEAYETIPCICVFNTVPSLVEKIAFAKHGLFGFGTPNDWDALTVLCTTALVQGQHLKNNQLKSNELNRLLSTNYLVLDAKNSQLEQVKDQLIDLKINVDHDTLLQLNTIVDGIQKNLNKEHQYQLFKVHFEEVHPLFYNKLLEINSRLTDNNLKLLAFLKMGFNNDEISFLLNISIAAVKKSIQRLKHKLHLDNNTSLREFIFSLNG